MGNVSSLVLTLSPSPSPSPSPEPSARSDSGSLEDGRRDMGSLDDSLTDEHDIPEDVTLHIFSFLDVPELLVTSLVCTSWNQVSKTGLLWRDQFKRHFLKDCSESEFSIDQLIRPLPSFTWKHLFFAWRAEKDHQDLIVGDAISASSTDYPEQGLQQVLSGRSGTFWSSLGSPTEEADEWGLFSLSSSLCLVHSVELGIYRANWQMGAPIYAPKFVKFSFGFSQDDFYHTTVQYPCLPDASLQTFVFDPPLLPGAFLKIDFIGKTQTQPGDDLYYTVLNRVVVKGRPVAHLQDDELAVSFTNASMKASPAFAKEMADKYPESSPSCWEVLNILRNTEAAKEPEKKSREERNLSKREWLLNALSWMTNGRFSTDMDDIAIDPAVLDDFDEDDFRLAFGMPPATEGGEGGSAGSAPPGMEEYEDDSDDEDET